MHFFMVLALLHRVESYYQGIKTLVSSLKREGSIVQQYLNHIILFIYF